MKSKKIKAVFKGQNGSMGYETDKEYTLSVSLIIFSDRIRIEKINGGGVCFYKSIIPFLDNWDNIRVLS